MPLPPSTARSRLGPRPRAGRAAATSSGTRAGKTTAQASTTTGRATTILNSSASSARTRSGSKEATSICMRMSRTRLSTSTTRWDLMPSATPRTSPRASGTRLRSGGLLGFGDSGRRSSTCLTLSSPCQGGTSLGGRPHMPGPRRLPSSRESELFASLPLEHRG